MSQALESSELTRQVCCVSRWDGDAVPAPLPHLGVCFSHSGQDTRAPVLSGTLRARPVIY